MLVKSTDYVRVRKYKYVSNLRHVKKSLKHIPPHWEKEHVERNFSFYGKIVNMKREPMKYSVRGCKRAYEKVWNGNWRIRMILNKSIPSNVIISG